MSIVWVGRTAAAGWSRSKLEADRSRCGVPRASLFLSRESRPCQPGEKVSMSFRTKKAPAEQRGGCLAFESKLGGYWGHSKLNNRYRIISEYLQEVWRGGLGV